MPAHENSTGKLQRAAFGARCMVNPRSHAYVQKTVASAARLETGQLAYLFTDGLTWESHISHELRNCNVQR